ncbi:unnamed protein product [Mycena citricolor]|uniref:Uncharacterized protein n=1 Tax=Mycena citricolor TaxID=2018698 RepID=A0AAD2K1E0_9AGAR|nr:unnamed protein product [Mycena citricolor]
MSTKPVTRCRTGHRGTIRLLATPPHACGTQNPAWPSSTSYFRYFAQNAVRPPRVGNVCAPEQGTSSVGLAFTTQSPPAVTRSNRLGCARQAHRRALVHARHPGPVC